MLSSPHRPGPTESRKSDVSVDFPLIVVARNKRASAINLFLLPQRDQTGSFVHRFKRFKRPQMKKLYVAVLALSVGILGAPVLTHGKPHEMSQDDNKPKLMNIKGTVHADGEKITFVADDSGKSWDVVNPEILKDHVGHHVEVSAHMYVDKDQIRVMKITML
jgi:hypothetical protein